MHKCDFQGRSNFRNSRKPCFFYIVFGRFRDSYDHVIFVDKLDYKTDYTIYGISHIINQILTMKCLYKSVLYKYYPIFITGLISFVVVLELIASVARLFLVITVMEIYVKKWLCCASLFSEITFSWCYESLQPEILYMYLVSSLFS